MKGFKASFGRSGGSTTIILLAILLFYFPSVLSIVSPEKEPLLWKINGVLTATFYTMVFCLNYFWLVPKMLIKNERKTLYFVVNICFLLLIFLLLPLWFESHGGLPAPKHQNHHNLSALQYFYGYIRFLIRDGIMMILAAALAYAMRLSLERENVRRRELELINRKREIELFSLKAQLNPHFLFNSLNNIYALIGFAPDRAQQALHDLSNMLRFMIYESGNSTVPLLKEIRFIRDYVALMRLRLGDNVIIECDLIDDISFEINVVPLLFLTLIENAFKHLSADEEGNSFIKISIKTDGKIILCRVENTFNAGSKKDNLEDKGIGLDNVRRQLELLYPERHHLEIKSYKGVYKAEIRLVV